jgi:Mrp family chromosome partitioning ATPase
LNDSFARQFRALRGRIETTLPEHAVIAVTSALQGDGASVTAAGLAEALKGAGYRCVLVDARGEFGDADPAIAYDFRLSPPSGMTISRGFALSAFRQLRSEADYIVVDTPPSSIDGSALVTCSAADAILVTIRSGRRQAEADQQLSEILGSAGNTVLGIVLVSDELLEMNHEREHTAAKSTSDVTDIAPKKVSSIVHG